MGIRDEEIIRKALGSLRDTRGYAYVDEKITLEDLDAMRQKVLEYSNLVNDLTDMKPDAVLLVEKMNTQRNMMIDYIIKLETYIQENHRA